MKKKLVLLPIIMLALAGCNNTNNSTPASEVDPATSATQAPSTVVEPSTEPTPTPSTVVEPSTTPVPSTVVEPSTTPTPSTLDEPIGAYQLVATHDFTTGTAKGSALKVDSALKVLNRNVTSGTSAISSVTNVSKVYDGNSSGGIGSLAGILKFGAKDYNGTITIKMNDGTNITKVVLNCHSYNKLDESHPENTSNFVKVNDLDSVAAPYNADGIGEDIEFKLSSATDEITIASEGANSKFGRFVLYSVSFYTSK